MKKKNPVTSKTQDESQSAAHDRRILAIYVRVHAGASVAAPPQSFEILTITGDELAAPTIRYYIDVGWSAATMERPAMSRLRADVRAGAVSCVMVRDFTRLTRNVAEGFAFAHELEAHRTRLLVLSSLQLDLSDGMALGNFAGLHTRAGGSPNQKLALLGQTVRASNGLWHGGCPAVGYTVFNGTLKNDPTSAKLIRRIFSLFLRLGGPGGVVRHLKAKGIRVIPAASGAGAGHVITTDLVRRILRNPVYAGHVPGPKNSGGTSLRWKPDLLIDGQPYFKGRHTAMISHALWQKVSAARALAATTHHNSGPRC